MTSFFSGAATLEDGLDLMMLAFARRGIAMSWRPISFCERSLEDEIMIGPLSDFCYSEVLRFQDSKTLRLLAVRALLVA